MRLLPLLVAFVAIATSVAIADAAEPRASVVVVDDAPAAPQLFARDGKGGVCVALTDVEQPFDQCGDPTRRDDEAAVTTYDGRAYGGVVPATAARIELVLPDGSVLRPALSAGPRYRGRFAGRVAFFSARAPARASGAGFEDFDDLEVRALDATGRLVGIAARGNGPATGRARVVVRRSVGRTAFVLRVRPVSRSAPTAASLDRRRPAACVGFAFGRSSGPGSTTTACFSRTSVPDDIPAHRATCDPGATALVGLMPREGRRAVGVLGDGTRLAATRFDLGSGLPGRQGFVLLVPGDRALRRVEVDGATTVLRRPPEDSICASGIGDSFIIDPFPLAAPSPIGPAASLVTEPVALLETGGHRLLAADTDDQRLCLAVDRADPRDVECEPLGRNPGALLVRRSTAPDGGTVLAGVVREGVPGVAVVTDDRRVLRVPTGEASGAYTGVYTGVYAGRLRPFLIRIPAGRKALSVVAVGTSGRPVEANAAALLGFSPPRFGPRRVGRFGAGLVVWSAVLGSRTDSTPCAAITSGRRPTLGDLECTGSGATSVQVEASCESRRIAATAILPGRTASLEARTSGGNVLSAASVGIGGGLRLHRLALSPDSAPRTLTVRRAGQAPSVRRIVLPPAAEQCGYDADVYLRGSPE